MFTIQARVGFSPSGGTVVAHARFDPTGHPVVLKAATRPGTALLDETALLLRLRSRRWMPVVASGRAGAGLAAALGIPPGMPWYAMPPGTGATLSSVEPPLPAAEWAALARGLLSALAEGHAADVIHGDLKPANIWWDAGKRRLTLADPQGRRATGTQGWRCPSRERGDAVTESSDLFSAGLVLTWARLGTAVRPSLDGPRHTQQVLTFWGVPGDIAHWLATLSAVEPRDRFPTARAALAAMPFDEDRPCEPPEHHPARIMLGRRLPGPAPQEVEERPTAGPHPEGPPRALEAPGWATLHLPTRAPALALARLKRHPMVATAQARLAPEARRRSRLLSGSPAHSPAPWRHIGWLLGRADGPGLRLHLEPAPAGDDRSPWAGLVAAARGRIRVHHRDGGRCRVRSLSLWLRENLRLAPRSAQETAQRARGAWAHAADDSRRIFEAGGATWTAAGWLLDPTVLEQPSAAAAGAAAPGPGGPPGSSPTPKKRARLLELLGPRVPRTLAIELASATGFDDPEEALRELWGTGEVELDGGDVVAGTHHAYGPAGPISPAERDALLSILPRTLWAARGAVLEWSGDRDGASSARLQQSEDHLMSGRREEAVAAWTRAARLVAGTSSSARTRQRALLEVHELGLLAAGCMASEPAGVDRLRARAAELMREAQAHGWPEVVVRALCIQALAGERSGTSADGGHSEPHPAWRETPWTRLALVRQARMEAGRLGLRAQTLLAATREAELWLEVGRPSEAIAAAEALLEGAHDAPRTTGAGPLLSLQLRLGEAMRRSGEGVTAERLLQEAARLAHATPDAVALALAHEDLGNTAALRGVQDRARQYWNHAYHLYTEMADPRAHAIALRLATLDSTAAHPDAPGEWAQRALMRDAKPTREPVAQRSPNPGQPLPEEPSLVPTLRLVAPQPTGP